MKTKYLISLISFTFFYIFSSAQTQTIRGIVKDINSDVPLVGVNIVLANSDPFIGTVTDLNGEFSLENVPVGRQEIVVSYIGYLTQIIPNILLTAGKEVQLRILLVESVETLDELMIISTSDPDKTNNEMAKVSSTSFSLEEVQRYSGGRNDVARLATNFAGVKAADDARNDIVVRGNSPVGVLWRINTLPIANTNHFSTFGTTGGPVSALNTNVLRNSDFLTAAFPAEYGNANAAVFDVKFRNGNTENFEFLAQVSAFSGMEFMAEGPINKEKQSSFLIAYRYGIASLAATGTSAIPYYQDLSFTLNFGNTKAGRFEFFGLLGKSNIDFLGDEIEEGDLFANPNNDAYVTGKLGMLGLSHLMNFKNNSYLKTVVGVGLNANTYNQDNIIRDNENETKYRATEVNDQEFRYTISSQYNKKYNARFNARMGGIIEVYDINSNVNDRDNRADIPDDNNDGIPDYFIPVRSFNEISPLYQAYWQGEYRFTDELSWNFGLHGQYLSFNNSYSIEPRTGLSWYATPNQEFSFGYGLLSQPPPYPVLFYQEPAENGEFERTNADLNFMRSSQFVLGYNYTFSLSWRLKAEVYHQYIYDAPIEQYPSSYSAINEGSSFAFTERGSLVSEGNGQNYGLEITIEKYLSNGIYTMLTSSLFNSTYQGSDNITRSTAFNNKYIVNWLFGKEWYFGSNKKNAITFDTKITYSGGNPYTPINLEATRGNQGREVYYEDQAYSQTYPYYFRWDIKFGVRINSKKQKISQQLFFDLQNITNRENVQRYQYNTVTDEINTVTQIGFFPDFMYRIEF